MLDVFIHHSYWGFPLWEGGGSRGKGGDEFDQCRRLSDTGPTSELVVSGTREVLRVLREEKFLVRYLAKFYAFNFLFLYMFLVSFRV